MSLEKIDIDKSPDFNLSDKNSDKSEDEILYKSVEEKEI